MPGKKKTKVAKRYYGVTKVKTGAKLCWVSRENRVGFSLGLALGSRTIWLTNMRFADPKELKRVLKASLVTVYVKNSKYGK